MPTSLDFNYHFLAKMAKSRLVKEAGSQSRASKPRLPLSIDLDFYYKVVKILASEETVYNPISRLIGKDLERIPDSCEKQRVVLDVINRYSQVRHMLKRDLTLALKEKRNFELRDITVDPVRLLQKLHN